MGQYGGHSKQPSQYDTESRQSNADSAVKSLEDGLTYFVKPLELVRTFSEQIVSHTKFWATKRAPGAKGPRFNIMTRIFALKKESEPNTL